MGEDDPQLRNDLLAAKASFDAKMAAAQAELEILWAGGTRPSTQSDAPAKLAARDAMVALLNRRSYHRNLVRDVNDALES